MSIFIVSVSSMEALSWEENSLDLISKKTTRRLSGGPSNNPEPITKDRIESNKTALCRPCQKRQTEFYSSRCKSTNDHKTHLKPSVMHNNGTTEICFLPKIEALKRRINCDCHRSTLFHCSQQVRDYSGAVSRIVFAEFVHVILD